MSDLELTLSSAVTKNSRTTDLQGEFTFIVGSERFNCPRIVAEFLSRRIFNAHLVDQSITEYVVQTPDPAKQFKLFLSLGEGSTIRVDESTSAFFVSICGELDNPELCTSLLKHFASDIDRDSTYGFYDECFLGFLASQFYTFNTTDLKTIPLAVLYDILSHDSLVIESEDWLYSYITCHLSTDPEYWELLQFIQFEYLSVQSIVDFDSIHPERIDRRLWDTISRRLMLRHPDGTLFLWTEITSTPVGEISLEEILADYFGPGPPEEPKPRSRGIISYLTREHGGNLHDKEIVTITTKSQDDDPSHAPRNVFDLDSWSIFLSQDEPNQWICFDFRSLRVSPTHYTVRADSLNSWFVESSVNGLDWVEIDRRTGEASEDKAFAVSNSDECRFIRLTQTTGAYIRPKIVVDYKPPDVFDDYKPPRDDFLSIFAFDVFGNLRG
jgi:hypothetical protein